MVTGAVGITRSDYKNLKTRNIQYLVCVISYIKGKEAFLSLSICGNVCNASLLLWEYISGADFFIDAVSFYSLFPSSMELPSAFIHLSRTCRSWNEPLPPKTM